MPVDMKMGGATKFSFCDSPLFKRFFWQPEVIVKLHKGVHIHLVVSTLTCGPVPTWAIFSQK